MASFTPRWSPSRSSSNTRCFVHFRRGFQGNPAADKARFQLPKYSARRCGGRTAIPPAPTLALSARHREGVAASSVGRGWFSCPTARPLPAWRRPNYQSAGSQPPAAKAPWWRAGKAADITVLNRLDHPLRRPLELGSEGFPLREGSRPPPAACRQPPNRRIAACVSLLSAIVVVSTNCPCRCKACSSSRTCFCDHSCEVFVALRPRSGPRSNCRKTSPPRSPGACSHQRSRRPPVAGGRGSLAARRCFVQRWKERAWQGSMPAAATASAQLPKNR